MKVELTDKEAHNIRAALRLVAKSPELDENAMIDVLTLSSKFINKPDEKEVEK